MDIFLKSLKTAKMHLQANSTTKNKLLKENSKN